MYMLQRRAAAAVGSAAAARAFSSSRCITARQPSERALRRIAQAKLEARAAALLAFRNGQRSEADARRGRFAPDAAFRLGESAAVPEQAHPHVGRAAPHPRDDDGPKPKGPRRTPRRVTIQWSEGVIARQRFRELLGQQARAVLADFALTESRHDLRRVAREAKRANRLVADECNRIYAERSWHAPLPLPLPPADSAAAARQAELRDVPLEEQLVTLAARLAKASWADPDDKYALGVLVRLRDDVGALWCAAVDKKAAWAREAREAEAAAEALRLSQELAGRQAVALLLPPPPAASSQRMSGSISPEAPFALLASAPRASRSRLPPLRSAASWSLRRMHSEAAQHTVGTQGAATAPDVPVQQSTTHDDDSAGSKEQREGDSADIKDEPRRARDLAPEGNEGNEGERVLELYQRCCDLSDEVVLPDAARPFFKLPDPRLERDNMGIALEVQQSGSLFRAWRRARTYLERTQYERLLSGLPTGESLKGLLPREMPSLDSGEKIASAIALVQGELKRSIENAQKLAAAEDVSDNTATPSFAVADSVKALRAVAADFDELRKQRQAVHHTISLEPEDSEAEEPKAKRAKFLRLAMEAAAGHASRARDAADRLERGESVDASSIPLLPPAVEKAIRDSRRAEGARVDKSRRARAAHELKKAAATAAPPKPPAAASPATPNPTAASVVQRAAADESHDNVVPPQEAHEPHESLEAPQMTPARQETRKQRRESRLSTSRDSRVGALQSRLAGPRAASANPMTRVLEEQAVEYRSAALRAAAAAKKLEKALARKAAAKEALAATEAPQDSQIGPAAQHALESAADGPAAAGPAAAQPAAAQPAASQPAAAQPAAAEPAAEADAGPGGSWGPDALAPAAGASGIALSPMTPRAVAGAELERPRPPHLAAQQAHSPAPLGPQRITDPEPVTELFEGTWIEALRVVRPRSTAVPSEQFKVWGRGNNEKRIAYLERKKVSALGWEALKWQQARGGVLQSSKSEVRPVKPLRKMQVPRLAHNLSRVLFNPGVHWLREPRTGIYNFDPALRHIADVDLFDYDSLTPYVTSSADPELAKILKREGGRYCGSTSSLTGALSQIYFHLSHWRHPDFSGFSEGFASQPRHFGAGARLPASIRLRKTSADGEAPRYAVDQDKSASGDAENSNYILTQLGKALENFFTKAPEEYAKHLRVNSHMLTPEERSRPESYHYARARSIVMRSQLDCADKRLPGRTFDLKTRAVAAVRQDRANWVESGGYAIRRLDGAHESFEREMYDLVRSAFLKYYFQARIGHMDGIFLAYHSTSSIFGFQYVPLEDMAQRLFGGTDMAEQAFRLSVALLEELLDAATDFFPNESLKITFDTARAPKNLMDVYVEPDRPDASEETAGEATAGEETASEETASEEGVPSADAEPSAGAPRTIVQLQVLLDRYLDGQLVKGPVDFAAVDGQRVDPRSDDEPSRRERAERPPVQWSVEWAISPCAELSEGEIRKNLAAVRERQSIFNELALPNIDSLNARDEERLEELAENPEALARFKAERAAGTAAGMPTAPGQTGEATAPLQPEVQWKKATRLQQQLRRQARLAHEDKLQWDKDDKLEMWRPDSPWPAQPARPKAEAEAKSSDTSPQ